MENTNIDLKETIAKNIIKYRKTWGYTQAELADILNYSDKTLSKWERAESSPDTDNLICLANLYNVSIRTIERYIQRIKVNQIIYNMAD